MIELAASLRGAADCRGRRSVMTGSKRIQIASEDRHDRVVGSDTRVQAGGRGEVGMQRRKTHGRRGETWDFF
jgi:hypothetical protein